MKKLLVILIVAAGLLGAIMSLTFRSTYAQPGMTTPGYVRHTSYTRGLANDATAAEARQTLEVEYGVDIMAYDPNLQSLAGIDPNDQDIPYWVTAGTMSSTPLSDAWKTELATDPCTVIVNVLDDQTAAQVRATIGAATSILYDVNAYGAEGDGVTDDTTAISDTFDAADANGGGVVWFPAGTYILDDLALDGYDNIIVRGEGRQVSTIKTKASAKGPTLQFENSNYIVIEHLSFDNNVANQLVEPNVTDPCYPLYLNNCDYVHVRECYFTGGLYASCKFYLSDHGSVKDCYFTGAVQGSPTEVIAQDLSGTTCSHMEWSNNTMYHSDPADNDNGIVGIFMSGVKNGSVVSGNHLTNCGRTTGTGHQGASIDCYGDVVDVTISDNKIIDSQYMGIRISSGSSGVRVVQNLIDVENTSEDAILIYGDTSNGDTYDIHICDNTISTDGTGNVAGVYIVGGTDQAGEEPNQIFITGNHFTAGGYGIWANYGLFDSVIASNVFETTNPSIRLSEGSNTHVKGILIADNICDERQNITTYSIGIWGESVHCTNNLILNGNRGYYLQYAESDVVIEGGSIDTTNYPILLYDSTTGVTIRDVDYIDDDQLYEQGDETWQYRYGPYTNVVDINAAEIKDLVSSPFELVPAGGAGTLIEIVSVTLVMNYGSEVLAEPSAPDDLAVEYDDGTGQQIWTGDSTGFITNNADCFLLIQPDTLNGGASAITTAANVNKNVALINTGSDYTGNASNNTTIRALTTYTIHRSLGL